MEVNKIYLGDNIEILKSLPDNSVNCCITSPPYYGLRDYGTGKWIGGDPNCPHFRTSHRSDKTSTGHKKIHEIGGVADSIYKSVCPKCGAIREDKQVGLEETPEEYIDRLVGIFEEVRRVLKDDGTLWVNIGDTYNSTATGSVNNKQVTNIGSLSQTYSKHLVDNCKPKDLIGIPWMLAFALRNAGWYLRQDIIFAKRNPMPESVLDRCTKSHEYIFLLSKSSKYYFDNVAIQEDAISDPKRYEYPIMNGDEEQHGVVRPNSSPNTGGMKTWTGKRNKRDVWTVNVSRYSGAHFATFPEELIYPMVMAGCPKDGIVLDPFMGSGTVGVVAKRNHRNYIGCELNETYLKMAEQRIHAVTKKLF